MKNILLYQKIYLVIFLFINILYSSTSQAQTETIWPGSYLINMGNTNTASINDDVKPYGLIYDLMKNYNVPIKWVIAPGKVKDGIDFIHNGIQYKGGTFIIPTEFRDASVNARITYWAGQGVVGATSVSAFDVYVYKTLVSVPRWTLDAANGSIAQAYLTAAGITLTAFPGAYNWKSPQTLDCCDDFFVMPHANPTWATHSRLYSWNKDCLGSIWAACHAVSALENSINPSNSAEQMNFLSTRSSTYTPSVYPNNSLTLWGSHSGGSVPYTHRLFDDPVAQYMGVTDLSQLNGSEQIYLPKQSGPNGPTRWRPGVNIIAYDPTQADVSSPDLSNGNVAAVIAYGRGFDDNTRGFVMYEAGHSHMKGTTSDGPALRAFLNFSFFQVQPKAPQLGAFGGLVNGQNVTQANPLSLSISASSPLVGVTFSYQWVSSCGGIFSNPTGASTTYTPPSVGSNTNCTITCIVSDNCGRKSFQSETVTVVPPPRPPVSVADAQSVNPDCGSETISKNVLANDSDPDGDPIHLTLVNGNAGSFTTANGGLVSFTAGGNISYTNAEGFYGTETLTYTVCDNSTPTPLCSNGTYIITVGNPANIPPATNDAFTIAEDAIGTFNVLANDLPVANGPYTVYAITSGPSNGKAVINTDYTITYVPDPDFAGTDVIRYRIVNALGYSKSALINITVTNDACDGGTYQMTPGSTTIKIDTINATTDTYIDANKPTENYGGDVNLQLDRNGTKEMRMIIKWSDLSKIPAGATIDSAVIQLYEVTKKNQNINAHLMQEDWTEGSGSIASPNTTNDASWTRKTTGTNWTTANVTGSVSGPFYSTPVLSSITGAANNTANNVYLTWPRTVSLDSVVQGWKNGTISNYGVLFRSPDGGGAQTQQWGSRTNANPPRLIVKYTSVIPPVCAAIPVRAPLAQPDTAILVNGTSVNIPVAANDYYPAAGTKTYSIVTTPASGTATIDGATGVITYTASGTFNGIRTMTYRVLNNTTGLADTARVYIKINDSPVVAGDDNPAGQNSGTVQTITVLTNDNDPEGAALSVSIVTQPAHGTATVNGSNQVVYTPDAAYTGTDVLTYRVCEPAPDCGEQVCDDAIVNITVLNQPPAGTPDSKTILPCLANTIDLLSNDTDPEGHVLTISSLSALSNPAAGTLVNNNDGTVTFTPATGFLGTVSFTYTLIDNGTPPMSSATPVLVTIVVNNPPNTSPVAGNDAESTNMEQVFYAAVLDNDSDPENQELTLPVVTVAPQHGTAVVLANGLIQYTPNPGFSGHDVLTYQICDKVIDQLTCTATSALCTTADLDITVEALNTVLAINDENSTWINTVVNGSTLTNDADPQGDLPLVFGGLLIGGTTYTTGAYTISGTDLSGAPVATAGDITINADGTYTFTPANNFTGSITVPYVLNDSNPNVASDTADLHITVNPLPSVTNSVIANNDEISTLPDSTVNSTLFANDRDPQNNTFTVTSYKFDTNGDGTFDGTGTLNIPVTVGGITTAGTPLANAGTLTLNADGSYTFTPVADFSGTIDIPYTITDDLGATSTATLHIDVTPDYNGSANDLPQPGDDFVYTYYNNPVNASFISNDTDPNANPVSVSGVTINTAGPATPIGSPVSTAKGGTVQFYADGSYIYTPPTGYSGPDLYTYQVCDVTAVNPQPLCASATIYMLIAPNFLALPATGFRATVTLQNETAIIRWETLTEQNTWYFMVERSLDNMHYEPVGNRVAAAGNTATRSVYQLADNISSLNQQQMIYYRVRMTDIDGKVKYSNVATLRLEQTSWITAWPNPFNSFITINISSGSPASLLIRLTDLAGRQIKTRVQPVARGIAQVVLQNLEQLISGIYFLEITDQNSGKHTVYKLYKE